MSRGEPRKWQEGVFHDIPEDEYHSIEAASSSKLSKLKRSPAHMKAAADEDKQAFRDGTLIHQAVLEAESFRSAGYVRGPAGDKRTKAVKAEWNVLAIKHGLDRVLDPKTYDMLQAISMVVESHPVASAMLSGTDTEVTIMWRDPATGVKCKGRIDALPKRGLWSTSIVDVKSTKDASMSGFSGHFYRYGYHRQMAFYLQGLEVLGVHRNDAHIIAVEKYPPFAVALYRCDEGSLDAGYQENQVLLRRFADCLERDHWPGYPETPQDLSIPTWAYAQVDDFVTSQEDA